jgi:hypothetical protein
LTAVKEYSHAAMPSTAVSIVRPSPADHQGGRQMSSDKNPQKSDGSEEPVPFMQKVLDNPFLLLFLGVTIPTVLYLIWGVMEVANIPIAK